MPRPYLIALCVGSSLDQGTNNYTLFNLTEELQVENIPARLPLELHVYYEFNETERGRDFEIRIVITGEGDAISRSAPFTVVSHHARHRVRFQGFEVPAFGQLWLFSEIRPRHADSENLWERSRFGWPLVVSRLPEGRS